MSAAERVLVTGATSGIGLGLARAFKARGSRVFATGRNDAALEMLGAEGFEPVRLDVGDPQSIRSAAAELRSRVNGLDVVINNAGVQKLISFADDQTLETQDLDLELDVNLRGLIHCTRALLPLLRHGSTPRLVQVGSGLGYVPLVAAPLYSATKAAVHAFSTALREQLAPQGIQVVLLVPPVVETGLHREQTQRPRRAMSLEAFISAAMRGLDEGHDEVVVGLARGLRVGARVAPRFFLRRVVNAAR